jgi:phospholipid/cholesterol/gamma-HCH transport system substrate-binding protein
MNNAPVNSSHVPFVRRHRDFFAGLFLLIPLVVIPALLVYTFTKAEFLQGWCHLYTTSVNSYGLTKGSPVTVSGMTIGYVQEVVLIREGAVMVKFKVEKDYQHLIRKDTRARFQQKNIMVGDWIIELTGGTPSVAAVGENDTLPSIAPVGIDKTINQVTAMVTSLDSLISGIIAGKGTVGKLLTEDTLVDLVVAVIRGVDSLVASARGTMGKTDTLLAEVTALGRNGNGFIDSLMFVSGKLRGSLDEVEAILKNLHGASDDVTPLLKNLDNDLGEAEKMMKTLEQSWLYRKVTGPADDPLLKESP